MVIPGNQPQTAMSEAVEIMVGPLAIKSSGMPLASWRTITDCPRYSLNHAEAGPVSVGNTKLAASRLRRLSKTDSVTFAKFGAYRARTRCIAGTRVALMRRPSRVYMAQARSNWRQPAEPTIAVWTSMGSRDLTGWIWMRARRGLAVAGRPELTGQF